MTQRSGLFGELRWRSEVTSSGGSAVATFHVTTCSLGYRRWKNSNFCSRNIHILSITDRQCLDLNKLWALQSKSMIQPVWQNAKQTTVKTQCRSGCYSQHIMRAVIHSPKLTTAIMPCFLCLTAIVKCMTDIPRNKFDCMVH